MKSRKRILIAIFIVVILLASAGLTVAMIIPSAEDLLIDSLEGLEQVEDFHAVVAGNADLPADLLSQAADMELPETISGEIELWAKKDVGPDGEPGFRVEVLGADKEELIGLTAVTNGTQFWLYDAYKNRVITGDNDEIAALLKEKMQQYDGALPDMDGYDPDTHEHPESAEEAVAAMLEYVTVERDGTTDLSAGKAYKILLTPIAEQLPEQMALLGGYVNFWLRIDDLFPLKIEYADSSLLYAVVEATTAEVNTSFPNTIFNFEVPEDAQLIPIEEVLTKMESSYQGALESDYELLTATVMPEGATSRNFRRVGETFVQRYELPDDKSFFIAQGAVIPLDPPRESANPQSVTVRGVSGKLFTSVDNDRSLLSWNEDDLFFVIGGDLTSDQVLLIAESLK